MADILSNLTGKRHLLYIVQEVILPIEPAVAVKYPGHSGSNIRPDGKPTIGQCEISLVQEIREVTTASGRGEVASTFTLDYEIGAQSFINLIEYKDLVVQRIENVSMPDYEMLHDYSHYEDEADPLRRWNLMKNGGPIINMNPSSRRDTAFAARDRRRDDGSELRRRQEFTVVLTIC